MSWSPTSWRSRPIRQQPQYADTAAVERALEVVRALPALVQPGKVERLKAELARAAAGDAFLLQGGDCAERFQDCAPGPIQAKLKILLQMSLVLTWGARMPVVRVGRIAGQYAKPRSRDREMVNGVEVPSYRGDHVNGHDPSAREPDPNRLVQAYFHSAASLNYVRALIDAGFADLRHPEPWDLGYPDGTDRAGEYQQLVGRLLDALDFLGTTGVSGGEALRTVDFFSSHEGLLLAYEEAQTEQHEDRFYNVGAHFLWIGDRTRQLDGAHVEYFRGIANPIGIKVGPTMAPDELLRLLDVLNPHDEPGRITLITRFGADRVTEHLPDLLRRVKEDGRRVLWTADPMHGNTRSTSAGFKTRRVDDIMKELRQTFDLHRAEGTRLGGVHFELTGEDVTECVGGPQGLSEHDLSRSYETFCDPRLNYAQSLEMAYLIARRLQRDRQG